MYKTKYVWFKIFYMHIKLINKKLIFGNYKIKCAVGKRGITSFKKEGDKSTPKGNYCFKSLLYRRDRVPNIKTDLKKIIIKKNMGWCDDPQSKSYNKLIIIPNKFRFEKLYKKENMYDIILVIDYNLNPTIKNKASAIFLHVAKRNYSPTAGCIAVSKKDMHLILTCINKKTKIKIY